MLNGKESDISGEETTYGLDYVWDWGEGSDWKFAKVPYAIIWLIMNGQLTFTETKVILYLCRMCLGFKNNKGKSRELDLTELRKYTNIAKSHLSEAIQSLRKKGYVDRSRASGDTYKYSINLKSFGLET